jgi:hypothetical protein
MNWLGMIMAGALVAAPLAAQDNSIRIRSDNGAVKSHGEAAKADPGTAMGDGPVRGDDEAIRSFVRDIERLRNATFADGDLTQEEIDALQEKARERLAKDLEKFQDRERKLERETNPKARAKISREITFDRYRASLRALERDLLYTLARLRKPGGDKFERNLDNLQDNIKDTFADLHDDVDDGSPETWPATLETARKFHAQFHKDLEGWAEKIGVNADVPDAREYIVNTKKALRERMRRLKKLGGPKYYEPLEGIEDRILDTYEKLEERLEKTPPAGWAAIVKEGEKFEKIYAGELDAWATEIGGDEALPGPAERLDELKKDLRDRIADLRRIGGDEYEKVIDEIQEKVNDTFADLKDQVLQQSKDQWAATLETAAKFHRQYRDLIELWERKIVGAAEKIERPLPDAPLPDTRPRPEYAEKDIELPKGEHMDVVEGVRVARLMPLPKKQLKLEHGLSVNEITDADRALARAGLEVYDIILRVGDSNMDSRTDLRDAMGKFTKGDEFEVTVLRDGKEVTLKGRK